MIKDVFSYVFDLQNIKPIIVAIAKKEQPYIEEWVRWHIALGFDHIYLYDNEDDPIYKNLLKKYHQYITVIHFPGNSYYKGVQFIALDHFIKNFLYTNNHTHCIHLDIDEFIVLKQHKDIKDFIHSFFILDCGAIGINWRFFGDSGLTTRTNNSIVKSFIYRQKQGNKHIKSLFEISSFVSFVYSHGVILNKPLRTKNTKNHIISGVFNDKFDFDYIQINHYKTKTLSEFSETYKRGYVHIVNKNQNLSFDKKSIDNVFKKFNFNDEKDLTAYCYLDVVDSYWKENSTKIMDFSNF